MAGRQYDTLKTVVRFHSRLLGDERNGLLASLISLRHGVRLAYPPLRLLGVPVAHVLGKDGDWVRFPEGPLRGVSSFGRARRWQCRGGEFESRTLHFRGVRITGLLLACNQKTTVRLCYAPLFVTEGSRIRLVGPLC